MSISRIKIVYNYLFNFEIIWLGDCEKPLMRLT